VVAAGGFPVVATGALPVVAGATTAALVVAAGSFPVVATGALPVVAGTGFTTGVAALVVAGVAGATTPDVTGMITGGLGDDDPVTTMSAQVEYIAPFCQSHFHQRV